MFSGNWGEDNPQILALRKTISLDKNVYYPFNEGISRERWARRILSSIPRLLSLVIECMFYHLVQTRCHYFSAEQTHQCFLLTQVEIYISLYCYS